MMWMFYRILEEGESKGKGRVATHSGPLFCHFVMMLMS